MKINPVLAIDSYKLAHITMYPENIIGTYLNLTPRSIRHFKKLIPAQFKYDNKIVAVGMQMAIQDIVDTFTDEFFSKPLEQTLEIYTDTIRPFIGFDEDSETKIVAEITKLHNLGYLPLEIKALPEGSLVPVQTPVMTIKFSENGFAWLQGYLETYISQNTWKTITIATVARLYRKILEFWAEKTCDNNDHITWQGHCFADRGMSGTEDATKMGIAHATQFEGSDSVHAAYAAKHIYGFKSPLFAASVPATEHQIMQLGINESSERDTILRLIKQYPTGVMSVVCDTEDYWNTLTNILPSLKEEILARIPNSLGLAKFVVRPDSGDPTDVICGVRINQKFSNCTLEEALDNTFMGSSYIQWEDNYYRVNYKDTEPTQISENEVKGSIEILWDTFGGTINSKGYKVLNPRVGLIYGDSITPERAYEICKRLEAKGFASSNVVLGIGSYTYNYHTRDTFGMAIKCTAAWDDKGNLIETQKVVKTDSGKKSAKGLLHVSSDFVTTDSVTPEVEATGMLQTIYKDNKKTFETDFEAIRARARN